MKSSEFALHDPKILGGMALCSLCMGLAFWFAPNTGLKGDLTHVPKTQTIATQEAMRKQVVSFPQKENAVFSLSLPEEKKLPKGILFSASTQEVLRNADIPELSVEVISSHESTREKASLAIKGILFSEDTSKAQLVFSEAPPWYTEYVLHWDQNASVPLEIVP